MAVRGEKIAGRLVVQSDSIGGREVVLLELDNKAGRYLIGPGPNGRYAAVGSGDGDFTMAYRLALREGRFTEDLPGPKGTDASVHVPGKVQV